MGREVLRVPPDWQHPRIETQGPYAWQKPGRYQPMHMELYADALREWNIDNDAWEAGTHADLVGGLTTKDENPTYAEWGGSAPDPACYRHRAWASEEATAYQVYETVSDGTPVSPVLPSLHALIDWLMAPIPATDNYPDLSVQGMTREQAERFAGAGWAPSFIGTSNGMTMGAKAI